MALLSADNGDTSKTGISNSSKENPISHVRTTDTQLHGQDQYLKSWKLGLVTGSLYFGTLLVAIDTTIISVAVPKLSTVFNALDDVGWYGSGYLLTVTACQPSFGKIYKFFDVKATYLTSIVIFEGQWQSLSPHPHPWLPVLTCL